MAYKSSILPANYIHVPFFSITTCTYIRVNKILHNILLEHIHSI